LFLRRRVPETGYLKAAVIGAGAFGRHHATKYRALSDNAPSSENKRVELFAIADPSPEVRRTAVAQYGVLAVADWRELLGKVDLVSICSPALTHAEIVRAFLNTGAHVLVEKPIATTLEEANDLVALARQTGLVLTVGHQERFVFARTGLLGQAETPLEIQCWRRGPWTGRGDDVSAVLDLMIHDLDLVHTLVDSEVADVNARGLVQYGPHADEVSAAVTFANGTVARLDTSRVAETRKRGLRAVYEDGVVEIDFLTREVKNTTPRPLAALEMGDPLGESVANFVAAARDGSPTLVSPEQAARALATALRIDEAAEASIPALAPAVLGRAVA
jgi:predicted dehydrogenase